MTVRENLGLQVALIVFCCITIVLATTTYIYFTRHSEKQQQVAQLTDRVDELHSQQQESRETIESLKKLISDRESSTLIDLQDAHARDVQQVHSQLAESTAPAYQRLVRHLLFAVSEVAQREMRIRSDLLAAREDLRNRKDVHQAQLSVYQDHQEQLQGEMAQQRQRMGRERSRFLEQTNQLAQLVREKMAEIADGKAHFSAMQQTFQRRIAQLGSQYQRMRQQWEMTQYESVENPDGKVTAVDGRSGVVYLNRGSADLLPRGLTMIVYDAEAGDVSRAKKKALIEVTKVVGQHTAEARILEEAISNPVLPDDIVFTPLWEPGQRRRFALAGVLDIDGDGQDDRRFVEGLIAASGGLVDARVDDRGHRDGELSINTRYIVVGKRPTNINRDALRENAYATMLTEASELGIDQLSVQRFLELLDHRPAKVVRFDQDKSTFQRRRPLSGRSAY